MSLNRISCCVICCLISGSMLGMQSRYTNNEGRSADVFVQTFNEEKARLRAAKDNQYATQKAYAQDMQRTVCRAARDAARRKKVDRFGIKR